MAKHQKSYQKPDGGAKEAEVVSTVGNTLIGEGLIPLPEKESVARKEVDTSAMPRKSGKPKAKNGQPGGTQSEWLSIMQQVASQYQKSGGSILVFEQGAFLVLALNNVGKCDICSFWYRRADGCPNCMRKLE